MASVLQQLDPESVLMLYLADELSPEDRDRVRQLLAGDPDLAGRLEELRRLSASVDAAFAHLDASGVGVSENMALRRTLRDLRRRHLESQTVPPAAEDRPRRRMPAWAYPLVAAAAVAFILIGLWGVGVIELPGTNGVANRSVDSPETVDAVPPETVAQVEESFASVTSELDRADAELQALRDETPFLVMSQR